MFISRVYKISLSWAQSVLVPSCSSPHKSLEVGSCSLVSPQGTEPKAKHAASKAQREQGMTMLSLLIPYERLGQFPDKTHPSPSLYSDFYSLRLAHMGNQAGSVSLSLLSFTTCTMKRRHLSPFLECGCHAPCEHQIHCHWGVLEPLLC